MEEENKPSGESHVSEKVQEPVKQLNEGAHHQEGKLTKKMRENPWILSTFVLGILALIFLMGSFGGMTGGTITGGVVDEGVVESAVLDFVQSQGADAEVVSTEEDGNFYKVIILFQDQEIPLYVTKDGEFLVQGLTPLKTEAPTDTQRQATGITKSDKPEVELFVMTHCPYGTQAEKGFIPMMKALGDAVNAKIRFVHYFMHDPEETETPIQVCIREEQSDKYLDYLECFLEDGNSNRCLTKTGINQAKMNECISNGKAEEYYAEDSTLSESYGVGGSPTLVINGVIAQSGRDSASYLNTICSAFNTAPEACSIELSSASPSPGFGYSEGSATEAQC